MKLSELIEKLQEIKKDKDIERIVFNNLGKIFSVELNKGTLYINNEIQSYCPRTGIFYYYNFSENRFMKNEFVPVDRIEFIDWSKFCSIIKSKVKYLSAK